METVERDIAREDNSVLRAGMATLGAVATTGIMIGETTANLLKAPFELTKVMYKHF